LPIDRSSKGCLKCHGDPKDAPGELITMYGDTRGFHESPNSIRALISIRIPLSPLLKDARDVASMLSIMTLIALSSLYALVYYFILRVDREQREVIASHVALRDTKERLEAAASAGIVGIWEWDVARDQMVWDDVMYSLYGKRREEFGGTLAAWLGALHPDDKRFVEEHIHAALSGKQAFTSEFRVIWADGVVHYLKAGSRTIFDDQGKPVRMIGVNYDITDQKSVEEMLENRVAERTRELAKARDAAQAANVAKSAFLANMSHEMRTPLNHIVGLTNLLCREPLSSGQADKITKLEAAEGNLSNLIDRVLMLTKIEAEQFDLKEIPFRLSALIEMVVQDTRAQIDAKHLGLSVEASEAPDRLIGDADHLKTAILNYLHNAIRFTESGTITLRVKQTAVVGPYLLLRFEVEDTGIGIAPEDQERLFSIFEQVDNSSTRKYGGMGLGLAMTRKIAEIMGGNAGCESAPREGSIFWFTVRLKTVD
jgi:PAS domain S-box-containing protein